MKIRAAAVAALTLAVGLVLSACTSTAPTPSPSVSASPTASEGAADFNDADAMFAMMMIPHHEQAIEMADLVLGKEGVDQRVIDLAEAIQAAQRPEIERLQGWLADWGVAPGNESTGHEGHGDGMMSADDMTALQNASGAEASRLFLEQMIVHHEGAVDMAQMQVDNGQNPDVIALAQDIIDAQTTEIQQMRDLLASL